MDEAINYSSPEYWDQRYQNVTDTYDWYNEWPEIKRCLPFKIDKIASVLHIGCGNSRLGKDLMDEGVEEVKNVDISENCINAMKRMYPELDYEVMDVMDLAARLPEYHYDFVIDKGCLDTILCSENFDTKIPAMLQGIHTILRYDGVLIVISVACPANRLMYLEASDLWTVSVVKMEKRHLELIDDAEMLLNLNSCGCGDGTCEKHHHLAQEESRYCSLKATEDSEDVMDERRHHFIYVCRKMG